MSYIFADTLLLRMPARPVTFYTSTPQNFLDDGFFRAALMLATPAYYETLAKKAFQAVDLSGKELHTLKKYINRFCFRPTPFGLFASVSLVSWGTTDFVVTTDTDDLIANLQPNQQLVHRSSSAILSRLGPLARFETNPTIYKVLREYRFIRTEVTEDDRRRYQLQSTDYSMVLNSLLKFCRQPRTGSQIIQKIVRLAHTGEKDSADYFSFLVDSQVLVSVFRETVTGKNHLDLLKAEFLDKVQMGLAAEVNAPVRLPDELQRYQDRFNLLINERSSSVNISVVLKRATVCKTVDANWQKMISDGLEATNRLCPPDELPAMEQFRLAFLRHFEGQQLPLLSALDPEIGLGYQNPVNLESNGLLETLNIHDARKSSDTAVWTQAHRYLMTCWLEAARNQDMIIRLDEQELKEIALHSEPTTTTLGFPVLFRIAEGKLLLESAGGNNPLALMGRFTAADTDIAASARKIARDIEALNPTVLFAEILHLTDLHTDNINRRAHSWSYELPVTAASTLAASKQLRLDDLFVTVIGDKVFLWSETHQMFVVPRLTTAYNHSLNKLPLFRFLADLSYSYTRTNFSFDLRTFFPGMPHYPRVEYKKTIISPATWILDNADLQLFREAEDHELRIAFDKLVRKKKLPPVFAMTDGDQQLVIFRDRAEDIPFFKDLTMQRIEVVITEFLADVIPMLNEEAENVFIKQYCASVLPEYPVKLPGNQVRKTAKQQTNRKFTPGSEWLYLKLYSPKAGASKLLLRIAPLLRKRFAHGLVLKWFFIRYSDDAPHIRLRLQIDPQDTGQILIAFKELLENHIHEHIIREYQVDIYSRELERYEAAGMEKTENLFWASSRFTLAFLSQVRKKAAPSVYLCAIVSVQRITQEIMPADNDQLDFYEHCYLKMLPEFGGKNMTRQLNQKYREFRQEIFQAISERSFFASYKMHIAVSQLIDCAAEIARSLPNSPVKQDYLHSILHMHLNRLFSDDQRLQEMIIYYLLFKHHLAERGRKKSGRV